MLIVGVEESKVQEMLEAGIGPDLPEGELCPDPDCPGGLGRWGSYPRFARRLGITWMLRIRRCRCRRCGRTHALLPAFLLGRRRDLAEILLSALAMAAEGRGHRPVAVRCGVPQMTARDWLRRMHEVAEVRRRDFAVLASELGALPEPRPPPGRGPLAALVEAIGRAHRAATRRFGASAAGTPWAFSSAASGGWLYANTSAPLEGTDPA